MVTGSRANARKTPGVEDWVSDDEVAEAIALFGGDPHEAIRALVGALHRLVSRGYARRQLHIATPQLETIRDREEAAANGR